tara:strand:- start:2931 stop:3209 length:279 start_codon:yes stop_codon:yes gene_type:complete
MKELENMEQAFNEFKDYLNEKIIKHQPIQSGESDCCGRPVLADLMLCSECKDHCDYAPKLCGYCGDTEIDEDEDFCCNDCWKGYEHETFRKD